MCLEVVADGLAPNTQRVFRTLKFVQRSTEIRFRLRAGTHAPPFKQNDIKLGFYRFPRYVVGPDHRDFVKGGWESVHGCATDQVGQRCHAEIDIMGSRHPACRKQRVKLAWRAAGVRFVRGKKSSSERQMVLRPKREWSS